MMALLPNTWHLALDSTHELPWLFLISEYSIELDKPSNIHKKAMIYNECNNKSIFTELKWL